MFAYVYMSLHLVVVFLRKCFSLVPTIYTRDVAALIFSTLWNVTSCSIYTVYVRILGISARWSSAVVDSPDTTTSTTQKNRTTAVLEIREVFIYSRHMLYPNT